MIAVALCGISFAAAQDEWGPVMERYAKSQRLSDRAYCRFRCSFDLQYCKQVGVSENICNMSKYNGGLTRDEHRFRVVFTIARSCELN